MAKPPPKAVSDYFRQIAEEGDYPSRGGRARADALTPQRRTEIAKAAAKASAAVRAAKRGPKKAVKKTPAKKAGMEVLTKAKKKKP
jgi:hypothetical protein